jgi:hypothetical protein
MADYCGRHWSRLQYIGSRACNYFVHDFVRMMLNMREMQI